MHATVPFFPAARFCYFFERLSVFPAMYCRGRWCTVVLRMLSGDANRQVQSSHVQTQGAVTGGVWNLKHCRDHMHH